MAGWQQGPREAGTVPVHVQVIDLEPFALDMTLPTYLPSSDLTQRVARDAGLGAYWEDGSRRNFYLRARGRLLTSDEKLEDLGIVPHELLHLLPEPPKNSGLEERAPEYPPNAGYSVAGNLAAAGGLTTVLTWTALWAMALTVQPSWWVGLLPGIGLALLATSFSRHLWGGLGSSAQIPVTGLLVYLPLMLLAAVPAFMLGNVGVMDLLLVLGPAFIGGVVGVMLSWLAWYGAVEPLPDVRIKDVQEAAAAVTWPCGICGGAVTSDVKADCVFACGRVFHQGCYRAKQSLGDGTTCAVCGYQPA
ncbi:MAG: hypothetical protein GWP91_19535 [Rhodobacterales bacterium]|nr:hypothetical protein [Rhodobacterales bacterium]